MAGADSLTYGMPTTRRFPALAGALVTCITIAACGDIPLLPQWDTDFYVPLGASNVNNGNLPPGTVIPPSSSASVPGPIRDVPMDGTIADLLDQVLDDAAPVLRLQVTITKSANLALAVSDTIYLAADTAGLATTQIKNGLTMPAGTTSQTDTLTLGANAIALLKQLTGSNGTLRVQARGRVSSGGSSVTVQNSDSLHVKIGLLVRVPVAGGK